MFYVIFGITAAGRRAGPQIRDGQAFMLVTYRAFGVIGAALFQVRGLGGRRSSGPGSIRLKRVAPMPPAHLLHRQGGHEPGRGPRSSCWPCVPSGPYAWAASISDPQQSVAVGLALSQRVRCGFRRWAWRSATWWARLRPGGARTWRGCRWRSRRGCGSGSSPAARRGAVSRVSTAAVSLLRSWRWGRFGASEGGSPVLQCPRRSVLGIAAPVVLLLVVVTWQFIATRDAPTDETSAAVNKPSPATCPTCGWSTSARWSSSRHLSPTPPRRTGSRRR